MTEAHRPRRVLVTGGAGFIGSGFVHHLLHTDPDVQLCTLDLLTYAGDPGNLEGLPDPRRHTLVVGDIADAARVDELFQTFEPDTVVHFAAESHVDRSIVDPGAFLRTNVTGTFVLLEAARRAWVGRSDVRFHHISTDEVYGALSPEEAPRREGDAYRPSSAYSASKAGSDHLVEAWARTYGLPVTMTLSCNVLGPRQHPEKLVPLMLLRALSGEHLPVYGDGLQVREWLHVDDVCAGIDAVIRRGTPGRRYHLSSERPTTNLELVGLLCDRIDAALGAGPRRCLIQHVADRPGHDRRYALDAGRIRDELGWRPALGLEAAVEGTVARALRDPGWLEAARARPGFEAWMARNYSQR